ncbi:hypothetical protein LCGC14_2124070 [marine sediment metagenome]|uniref:Antitoxin n=1 Tax=marine sediment metagenome TaxID=412755 RepID=A0A0F9EQI8_9ZZZZ
MASISISEAREHLADLGNRVALRGERLVVERRGRRLFALVPVADLELLERLEDKMDIEAIRQRLDEPSIPFEQVKKELDL